MNELVLEGKMLRRKRLPHVMLQPYSVSHAVMTSHEKDRALPRVINRAVTSNVDSQHGVVTVAYLLGPHGRPDNFQRTTTTVLYNESSIVYQTWQSLS